jgi:hypothetical protein
LRPGVGAVGGCNRILSGVLAAEPARPRVIVAAVEIAAHTPAQTAGRRVHVAIGTRTVPIRLIPILVVVTVFVSIVT